MASLERILRAPQLPSLPTVAVRLLELSRSAKTSTTQFVQVVEGDPAITAKILKLSNSSIYATRSEVTTVHRAVTLLGLNTVTSMALSFSVAKASVGSGRLAQHFARYWQQSVLQALTCEILCARDKGLARSEMFLTGLMLDIGQLAMLRTLSDKYSVVLDRAVETRRPLHEMESEALGFDHAEVGAALLEKWQFPTEIVRLSRDHNGEPAADSSVTSRVVALASAIGEYFFSTGLTRARTRLTEAAGQLAIGDIELDKLLESIAERYRDAAELFEADPDDLPDPTELMAAVNEELAERALRAQQGREQLEVENESLREEKLSLKRETQTLKKQTLIDDLTGCYNRGFFDETLAKEADICRRDARPIGLLFLDIDRFKALNDSHGHQFGDEVLATVSETLRGQVRESDVLARYGGEEFVLLARKPTDHGLQVLAERARVAVEELEFERYGEKVPVTISIGAVHAIPGREDPNLAERLVAEADEAMYQSKEGGRNRVTTRSLVSDVEKELQHRVMQRRFSLWLVARRVIDVRTAGEAVRRAVPRVVQIGELAVIHGYMTEDQVGEVLDAQIDGHMTRRFGELAIDRGYMTRDGLATLLALQAEDPIRVAAVLAEMGAVDPTDLAGHKDSYLNSVKAGQSPAVTVPVTNAESDLLAPKAHECPNTNAPALTPV